MNSPDNKKSAWKNASEELLQYSAQKKIPVSGTFELSSRCNLSCRFCYVKNHATPEILLREKSTAEWIRTGQLAADHGTVFLLITGGEPLIRSDFQEIYTALNSIGFHLILHTNGTLINEKFIQWFSPVRASKVAVTLYGASADTYRKTTGVASAFNKTLRGIDHLLEAGINTEIRSPLTRLNIHEAKRISSLGHERGINVRFFHSLIKSRRGISSDSVNVRLSRQEAISVAKFHISGCDQELQPGAGHISQVPLQDNFDIPICTDNSISPSAMKCMAGKSSYLISWDGKMLPCALMEHPFTLPFEQGFQKAWEKLVKQTGEITGPAECSLCPLKSFCDVCPARLQAETGSVNKLSPYICESAKTRKLIFDHIITLQNEKTKETISEAQTGNN